MRADQLVEGGSSEPDGTPNHVDSMFPEVGTSSEPETCMLHFFKYNQIQLLMLSNTFAGFTSKRKDRGKNKNNALTKLAPGQSSMK